MGHSLLVVLFAKDATHKVFIEFNSWGSEFLSKSLPLSTWCTPLKHTSVSILSGSIIYWCHWSWIMQLHVYVHLGSGVIVYCVVIITLLCSHVGISQSCPFLCTSTSTCTSFRLPLPLLWVGSYFLWILALRTCAPYWNEHSLVWTCVKATVRPYLCVFESW